MKLTKFGHSCFLVQENGVRVLFDPGRFSTEQNAVQNLDAVIFSHKHDDHLSFDSLQKIIGNNPKIAIYANKDTITDLEGNNLIGGNYPVDLINEGDEFNIKGLKVEVYGHEHKPIYPGIKGPENSGFFMADKLYYPGDSFYNPNKHAEIILFPITAPSIMFEDVFNFLKLMKPRLAIPVHDGNLRFADYVDTGISSMLASAGIKFLRPEIGKEYEL